EGYYMATQWVDFKALRQSLSFEAVLRHYKVEPKIRGKQHHGFCPLPKHGGKRKSPSFNVEVEKGIFHCFGCGAKGNVLEFAVLMDGGNPRNGADVRKTALALQERFGTQAKAQPAKRVKEKDAQLKLPNTGTVLVNARLDFEL